MAHIDITNRMLKTAEPTMVPMPTSSYEMNTPMMLVNSSGADPPAAMKVAPATSSEMPAFSVMTSKDGTKNSSQTMARATNMYTSPRTWKSTAPCCLCSRVNRSSGNWAVLLVAGGGTS